MRPLLVTALAAYAAAATLTYKSEHAKKFDRVARLPDSSTKEGQLKLRPSLLPYDAVANPAAVVTDSAGLARFTVLTPRLIRMESIAGANAAKTFEDRATIAILNRNVTVPAFTHAENGGVLTITTSAVTLTYTVGQPFSPSTLSVTSNDQSSAFKQWHYGDAFPGNLLGTIRGLDQQGQVSSVNVARVGWCTRPTSAPWHALDLRPASH